MQFYCNDVTVNCLGLLLLTTSGDLCPLILRQHMFYTKSVYTLVTTTKCTQGKQCDVYFNVCHSNTFCVIHFHKGQSYYHYLLQIPFVIFYIIFFLHQFVSVVYFLYTSSYRCIQKKKEMKINHISCLYFLCIHQVYIRYNGVDFCTCTFCIQIVYKSPPYFCKGPHFRDKKNSSLYPPLKNKSLLGFYEDGRYIVTSEYNNNNNNNNLLYPKQE